MRAVRSTEPDASFFPVQFHATECTCARERAVSTATTHVACAPRAFFEWPCRSDVRALLNASCDGGGGPRSIAAPAGARASARLCRAVQGRWSEEAASTGSDAQPRTELGEGRERLDTRRCTLYDGVQSFTTTRRSQLGQLGVLHGLAHRQVDHDLLGAAGDGVGADLAVQALHLKQAGVSAAHRRAQKAARTFSPWPPRT